MEPSLTTDEPGQSEFSIIPHLLAGVISFFSLWLLPPVLVDAAFAISGQIEFDLWFLSPIVLLLGLSFAMVAALGFTFVAIGFDHFGRQRRVSKLMPATAAFPVMWMVCLPEALTSDRPPWAWMAVSTFIAVAFCMHWFVVQAVSRKLE
jgi:hypothetical protein